MSHVCVIGGCCSADYLQIKLVCKIYNGFHLKGQCNEKNSDDMSESDIEGVILIEPGKSNQFVFLSSGKFDRVEM